VAHYPDLIKGGLAMPYAIFIQFKMITLWVTLLLLCAFAFPIWQVFQGICQAIVNRMKPKDSKDEIK
jgi:hypothetical protein